MKFKVNLLLVLSLLSTVGRGYSESTNVSEEEIALLEEINEGKYTNLLLVE